jgi:hypothetical protein
LVFRAVSLFARETALFRGVDVRRTDGVFLIFISPGDTPASGGLPPPGSAWTVFFFFGTDLIGVDDFEFVYCASNGWQVVSRSGLVQNRNHFFV